MRSAASRLAAAAAAAAVALALAGCAVGPDYARPDLELPTHSPPAAGTAPAAEKWWTVFRDPALERLVEEAIASNRDLVAAASRVEQARAQAAITGADRLPSAGVEARRSRDRASELSSFPPPADSLQSTTNRAALKFSWELDFWGKYRRASEAARADLVAAQAGRDAVRASLVAEVARAHHALQALDANRAVILETLEGRRVAMDLLKRRYDAGLISELELRQFEAELRAVQAAVPAIERDRSRQEGALAVLLGRSPRAVYEASIARGIAAAPGDVEVPAGLPSDLLRRRPDLREAEARLIAANARIGVATAAYYPSISLTGFLGGESQSLADLFTGPARTWSFAAGALQPIYGGGQIQGGVDLADARTREAAAKYESAVARAFKEVRDAIAAQSTSREALAAKRAQRGALARALELAKLRYEGGLVGLLEVLDAGRQLLEIRAEANNAERDRRDAVVDLFLALGS